MKRGRGWKNVFLLTFRVCVVQTLSSALGPLPSTLGSLAPLRGLDVLGPGPVPSSNPPLRGSLGGTPSSGGLEPLKTSLGVTLQYLAKCQHQSCDVHNACISVDVNVYRVAPPAPCLCWARLSAAPEAPVCWEAGGRRRCRPCPRWAKRTRTTLTPESPSQGTRSAQTPVHTATVTAYNCCI